jgi:trehalose/maltose hydrolase-like predicted phosphorylase
VVNANVPALARLAHRHLRTVRTEVVDAQTAQLEVITTQSQITVAMAARTRAFVDGAAVTVPTNDLNLADQVGQEIELRMDPGIPVTIEKIVATATSRDPAISTPSLTAAATAARAPDFPELLADHERAWADLWRRFSVTVEAGERARTALNLHTFHILQTAAPSPDIDAGLAARGLSGEGYSGHVFWDEILVHPLLTLRQPELTRTSLLYRYRRLGEARAAARAAGLAGALFPWQSGSDGRDETPAQLFNPLTGAWMPDNSRRQRHVGLAIASSVIQYVEASEDWSYLAESGMELIVEIVRCFASMATYDPDSDRYDVDGVMGPDEFHDGYPDRPGSGVRNNAYTNILLAWTANRAAALLGQLDRRDDGRTRRRLRLGGPELDRWDRLARRMRVPFHADGVISQFEGYADLAEFDWPAYRARYNDIGRLDLILAAEHDTPNHYRVSKQPDVLMLLYLLSAEDLRATLERLGYQFDRAAVRRTVAFYLARTSHGSTLSRPVCSWLLARADRAQSWSLFNEALDSDLADIQRGTTREGIHLGAMAGTVDLLLRCYTGLETRDGALWLHPALPPELERVRFDIGYRGHGISLELTRSTLTLHLQPREVAPIQVHVEDAELTLHAGHSYTFDLPAPRPGPSDPS